MPFSPSLAPSSTEMSLNIPIVHDQIQEETECFTCTIVTTSVPEKELLCTSPITTICIVDAGELSSACCFIMYMHSSCVLLPSGVNAASKARPIIAFYSRFCDIYIYIYTYIYVCLQLHCARPCTPYASPITSAGVHFEHWLLFGAPL